MHMNITSYQYFFYIYKYNRLYYNAQYKEKKKKKHAFFIH